MTTGSGPDGATGAAMRYSPIRHRRGFSMIELLIVLSMLAILATVSMGKTSRMITNWRVTRAAQAFQEELQAAFALVGRNRKPLLIVMDTAAMELRLTDRSGLLRYRRRSFGPSSEYQLKATNLKVYPTTIPTLELYPPGLAADSLSIIISKDGVSRRIRMLRGGLVQICSTGANNKC